MDWPRLTRPRTISRSTMLLLLILVVALGFRFYGINWDQGDGYHPDERSIYMRADCMYQVLTEAPGFANCIIDHPDTEPGIPNLITFTDADKSPLNPHWFPLGSILIYLLVLFRFLIEPFKDMGSIENIIYVGRTITALADTGTVFMVYLLGKRIYGTRVGLLAATLTALAVVHIQISHFYRPEPLQVFFLLVSFWFMLNVMYRRRLKDSALLGVFVGLAFATKVSVLPIVLPLALAYGFCFSNASGGRWKLPSSQEAWHVGRQALLALGTAAVVFFVSTPYALLDMSNFIDENVWQADNVAKTAGIVPFTVQYVGTTPFLYEIRQTSLWGLGIPLGIVAWGGLLFTLFRVTKDTPTRRAELLLLSWVVPTVIMLSIFEVKFLRYIFPVTPLLILMGSGMLFWALDKSRGLVQLAHSWGSTTTIVVQNILARYAPKAVVGAMALLVAATGFYALAFATIYSKPHTAIQASEWINNNVPGGSTIITDNHWDEGIRDIRSYDVQQVRVYEPDTVSKMGIIAQQLSDGDYLVFYSNRTYGSVARLPERYPLSSQYYRLLFSGELGYQIEKAFTSYSSLLGVSFVDDTFSRAEIPEPDSLKNARPGGLSLDLGYADENVIGYDHPKVLLLKNVEKLSPGQLFTLLSEKPEPPLGLMLSADQSAAQQSGGTWSEIIQRDSWANRVPVLAWLLLVELIYLAALPLATFLFRPLPDRGIILARLLGILGVAYVAWLLASLGWMSFSRTSVYLGILVVALLSGLVLKTRWREFSVFIRRNWRLLAIGEVLFLVAFLSFVALRAANPDLWHISRGGEKPMDFAYLNAVLKSTYMPPYDPWFAGGYLNYYYFGQFIIAALIKATGIIPSVAYNLAVPLLFALTVTAAYSLVYNLTEGLWRLGPVVPSQGPPPDLQDHGPPSLGLQLAVETQTNSFKLARGPIAAGLMAALFVSVVGNLDGIAQIVQGGWNNLFHGDAFPSLTYLSDFWRSSRMIPATEAVSPSGLTFWLPDNPSGTSDIGHHITEFPYFSFLFADLHAHMIAIPFTLLALGLAFTVLLGLRDGRAGWLLPAGLALAVALGALWAINSWGYPTYLLIAVALIGIGVYLRQGTPSARAGILLWMVPGVVVLSLLAYLPFHMNYDPFPTGLVASKWQTPLLNYLGIHGVFLFLIATFLVYQARTQLKDMLASFIRKPTSAHAGTAVEQFVPLTMNGVRRVPWVTLGGVVVLSLFVYMAVAGYWTVTFLAIVLCFVVWALRQALSGGGARAAYSAFPLVLVGLALLIGIGVEFIRVEGDIGRMNTLFKYYLDAWVLFALAAAYVTWHLGTRGFFNLRLVSPARGMWLGIVAILLVSSLIYPVLSTRNRLADRFDTNNFTLDGADYMQRSVHRDRISKDVIEMAWDYDAIRWMQDTIEGSPVILEGHNAQYTWSSRIADYTGLPTVLGWPWHQIQQRMKYNYAVVDRSRDVEEMYSTTDLERATELLKLYDVRYVVVGQLERSYYPSSGLDKFDEMVRGGLAEIAYKNQGIKIYRGTWYN